MTKSVSAVKNICKYTYNIVPKTYKTIEIGRTCGENFSKEHGYGKTRTFCKKGIEVVVDTNRFIFYHEGDRPNSIPLEDFVRHYFPNGVLGTPISSRKNPTS